MRRKHAVVRSRRRVGRLDGRDIKALLRDIGMPEEVWRVKDFWQANAGTLDWLLHDAEQAWKKLAVGIAPRAIGDDDEPVKQLNEVWQEIQKRFDAHINPRFYVPRNFKIAKLAAPKKADAIPEPPDRKKCRGCTMMFTPSRDHRGYHSDECREVHCRLKPLSSRPCPHCGDVFVTANPLKTQCGKPICKRKALKARWVLYHSRKKNREEAQAGIAGA